MSLTTHEEAVSGPVALETLRQLKSFPKALVPSRGALLISERVIQSSDHQNAILNTFDAAIRVVLHAGQHLGSEHYVGGRLRCDYADHPERIDLSRSVFGTVFCLDYPPETEDAWEASELVIDSYASLRKFVEQLQPGYSLAPRHLSLRVSTLPVAFLFGGKLFAADIGFFDDGDTATGLERSDCGCSVAMVS
ncbi:MAG: hypothetical protein AAFQ79_09910 [Pseudomonadota bacterium]